MARTVPHPPGGPRPAIPKLMSPSPTNFPASISLTPTCRRLDAAEPGNGREPCPLVSAPCASEPSLYGGHPGANPEDLAHLFGREVARPPATVAPDGNVDVALGIVDDRFESGCPHVGERSGNGLPNGSGCLLARELGGAG